MLCLIVYPTTIVIIKVYLCYLLLVLLEDPLLETSLVVEVQGYLEESKDLDVTSYNGESSEEGLGLDCGNHERIVVVVVLEEYPNSLVTQTWVLIAIVGPLTFKVKVNFCDILEIWDT